MDNMEAASAVRSSWVPFDGVRILYANQIANN